MKSIRKNTKRGVKKYNNRKALFTRKLTKRKLNNKRKTNKRGGMPPPRRRTMAAAAATDDEEEDPIKKYQQIKYAYSKSLMKQRAEDEKKGKFIKFEVEEPKQLCQWADSCKADTWRNKEKKEEHFEKFTHSSAEAEISELLYNLVIYKVNANVRNVEEYDADFKRFIQLCYRLYSDNNSNFPDWMYEVIRNYFKFHSEYVFDDYNSTHRLHYYLLASILKNVDYYVATYPNLHFWGLLLISLFEEPGITGIFPVPGKDPLSNTSLYFYIEKKLQKKE